MAKKLQPDVIEWILKLNSTQAQEEYHKLEKANRELKKENDATRKAMVELEKQGKKGSQEWKNLKDSITANNKVMAENRAKMDEISKRMDTATMTANQLQKRLKELQREFRNTSKATDPQRWEELRREIDKTKQSLQEAGGKTQELRGGFTALTKMKDVVTGFFLSIGSSIMSNVVGAFTNAFNIVVDFEKENSKLAAILGTTKEGIKDMMKAARDLGSTTSYSAAEVTQLQIELAKLGFAKSQILDMEGAVLKFAKAVDTDLASASAFTGAALRIFGKDASEAETALASFAVATTKTALDFSKLETALSTVGPVAAAAGFSLEDTTALLGQLANAGFDASSAATSTRNIILKMVDPAGALAKALGGPAKNCDELAKGFEKLQAQGIDLAEALELTDKRSVAAFQTFLEQSAGLVDLRDSITGVDDQFNQMADTMADNVSGAMAGLRSATEELMLYIADGTQGPLKSLIEKLTDWIKKGKAVVDWIREHSKWIKTIISGLVAWKVSQVAVNVASKAWLGIIKIKNILMATYRGTLQLATTAKNAFTSATNTATGALKAMGTAIRSLPWGMIIQGLTTVITMMKVWEQETRDVTGALGRVKEAEEEAAQQAMEHNRKREELNITLETEKRKLMQLYEAANDANAAEEDRIWAITELNRICPEFNGHLDKERGKLIANKKALDEYNAALETRMRLSYYKDEYEAYIKEEEKAKLALSRAQRLYDDYVKENFTSEYNTIHSMPKDAQPILYSNWDYLVAWFKDEELPAYYSKTEENLKDLEFGVKMAKSAVSNAQNAIKIFEEDIKAAGYSVEQVLSYNDSSGLVTDTEEPEPSTPDTDTETETGKGKGKGKGPRKDKIKEATRAADVLHQEKLAEIEKNKVNNSEYDYAIEKAEEMIRYAGDLKESLSDLRAATKDTDTEILEKIAEKEAKIEQDVAKAEQAINAANAAKAEKAHADRLTELEIFYDEQERLMAENVQKQQITQEAADIYMMSQEKTFHEGQLAELQRYYKEVEQSEYLGKEEREKRLAELQANIREIQRQILTDTGLYAEKLREMTENPNSLTGIKNSYAARQRALSESYDEMMKIAGKGSEEFQRLEEEKNRRILVLNMKLQEDLYKLQEQVGLSWADEYDIELLRLREMQAEGIISEEQYQAKRLEIGINHAKKYFDFYAGLSGSMFQAIQDAEIAMSDAKYDVLIRQAQNNGEETAELEQEKENKKLEIQKKYADVNFAIKVSQIIADTAVAIMKAFADLGPLGGAVAAAMLTATGVAQVMSANAEREKVKKLQPQSSASNASASSSPTATRVLSGFSEGGYTGNGERYEVAGLVHKGEYVVPQPIMSNPLVVDAVGTIEAIRLNRKGKTDGFAEGGYTSGRNSVSKIKADPVTPELAEKMRTMIDEMRKIFRNVKAYVVLQDLEKKQKQLSDARAPFRR